MFFPRGELKMVSADGINVLHFCKFDLISVIVPEPRKFFCIPVSAPDAAAVNSSGIKKIWLKAEAHFLLIVSQLLIMDKKFNKKSS